MTTKCRICNQPLTNPQINGAHIDCLANKWGDIIEKSPMVSAIHLKKEKMISITYLAPENELQELYLILSKIDLKGGKNIALENLIESLYYRIKTEDN